MHDEEATGQAVTSPITLSYTGTAKKLPHIIQHNKSKLQVKKKHNIIRSDIPELGQARKLL